MLKYPRNQKGHPQRTQQQLFHNHNHRFSPLNAETIKSWAFKDAFKSVKNPFGRLHAPSPCYLECINKLENVFHEHISIYTTCPGVGANILKKIKAIPYSFEFCAVFGFDYLHTLFIRLKVYYSVKFANRDFAMSKPKYMKISHL